jgi:LmbE family N-acetylglucosaminyl deacetylase
VATILHLAPHPDDELLGAPAALMAMRDAGHRVVNLACGLGGEPARREERALELAEACRRARFELRTDPLATVLHEERPAVVVSPSPHDGHPAHEAVARAAAAALVALGDAAPAWWLWGLWADLPAPNLLVPYDGERLAEIQAALAAYAGELARNDYAALLEARARGHAVLGPERVFGFGAAGIEEAYADLLLELRRDAGAWRRTRPRLLDPALPVGEPVGEAVDWWLEAPSAAARLRGPA